MNKQMMTAVAALLISTMAFAAPPMRFDAVLEGFNLAGEPVQTNAAGQARVEIIDDGTAVFFQIEVSNIRNLLMAHIHVNPNDVPLPLPLTAPAGPVVYWFTGGPPNGTTVRETIHGNFARGFIITDADLVDGNTVAGLIESIKAGRASIIVHTRDVDNQIPPNTQGNSPRGELRGTLQ